jgi:hypothetical protein
MDAWPSARSSSNYLSRHELSIPPSWTGQTQVDSPGVEDWFSVTISGNNISANGVLDDMRRKLGTVVRLLPVAIGVLFLCYVTTRLLLVYHIHRVSQMLMKVQGVNIGDSEDSIKPLLKRFGGYRWDAQLGALEDFNYVLEINPWGFPTLSNYKPGGREHPIGIGLNPRLRRAIGLRQWEVGSEIAIKAHQVVAVQAELNVEGETMWLGTSWRLSEKPREFVRDPTVEYLQWPVEPNLLFVTPAFLEMGTGGGTSWGFWVKPSSAALQRRVASRWNFGCLDSFRGCDSLCNLLPEAERFFNEHSELAPGGGGWDENSRSCINHESRSI